MSPAPPDRPNPIRQIGQGREAWRPPSVQGVNTDFDEIKLRNGRKLAYLLGDVDTGATFARTVEGASVVTVTIHDPHRKILNAAFLKRQFDINVDGLRFRLVKVGKSGDTLTLTFEDYIVAILKTFFGPKKAYRDKVTRAEFIQALVWEAGTESHNLFDLYCPEVHEIQPIKGSGRRVVPEMDGPQTPESDLIRAPGFERANLTVKGQPATEENRQLAALGLQMCDDRDANYEARWALICAMINESGMTDYQGGDRDSTSVLQVRQGTAPGVDTPEEQIAMFLDRGATGYKGGAGAVKLAESDEPITTWLSNMWWGIGSTNYPGLEFEDEAKRWVDAWTGSSGTTTATDEDARTGRYAFEVKKNESYWAAIQRLASEVQWRAFPVGDFLYYLSEPTLFSQRVWVRIDDDTPGVDDVDFDFDLGKPVTEVNVKARAKTWAAPPGTVVTLNGYGPADIGDYWKPKTRKKGAGVRESIGDNRLVVGRYIVSEISGNFYAPDVAITLKKPMVPLPEPAAETISTPGSDTSSLDTATGISGGAEKMVKWAKAVVGTAEGSERHARWAQKTGGVYDPWCSVFISYGIMFICGLPRPSNVSHSSTWLEWEGGKTVSKSDVQPGDILVFDWGDGGETDHVALYIGNGQRIGGNEGDAVRQGPAEMSAVVGVCRPNYKD